MAVRVDRHGWLYGFEWSTPLTLAVLAVATLTGSVPLAPVITIGAVLTVIVFLSVAITTGSGALSMVSAVAGGSALGWLIYAHLHSPWTATAVATLTLGWLAITSAGVISYAAHRQQLTREDAQAERERNTAELRKWTDLLEGVNIKGVTAKRVVTTRAGHVITYRLPADGSVKMAALVDAAERLDIARHLKAGATRFERGAHAGEVIMHSTERDVLADTIPYPIDLTPLTITEPFDIGWAEDGSLCFIYFRQIRLLIIGETGAGKTNLLNVIIAQLARCVDVIIFGIDVGKNGRLLAPWLKPWINRQCRRPVIDWPATTRTEAELLLASVTDLIDARSRGFAGKNEQIDPTTDQPVFVVVLDELGDLFTTDEPRDYREKHHAGEPTPRSLAWLGTRITNKGRSEAVDAIFGTQRSTVSHVPSNIKSQCALRIGLGVTTLAEAGNLLPDSPAAQKIMALMQHEGTGVVWRKNQQPHADKFYRITLEQIETVATWAGDNIRPEPNAFDRAALGEAYATRWERLAPLLTEWSDDDDATSHDRMFEQLVASVPDPEAGLKRWQRRAVEIVAEAGRLGIRPGMVADKLRAEDMGVDRATVQRFLRERAHEGFVENWKHGLWRVPRDDDGKQATGTDGH